MKAKKETEQEPIEYGMTQGSPAHKKVFCKDCQNTDTDCCYVCKFGIIGDGETTNPNHYKKAEVSYDTSEKTIRYPWNVIKHYYVDLPMMLSEMRLLALTRKENRIYEDYFIRGMNVDEIASALHISDLEVKIAMKRIGNILTHLLVIKRASGERKGRAIREVEEREAEERQ